MRFKKWIDVHDQSGKVYNKQIRFKMSALQSDLCDYSDAYIVVKGTITVTDPNNNAYGKNLPFKNNAPFIKINNTLIDNAEVYGIITEINQIVVQ